MDEKTMFALLLRNRSAARESIGAKRRPRTPKLGNHYDRLSPAAFEDLVRQGLVHRGASVAWTGGPGDGGLDMIAMGHGRVAFVQCKRWTHPVGSRDVRDFYGAMQRARVDEGFFVTTSRFTPEAQAFARGLPLTLVAGEDLEDWFKSSRSWRSTMKFSALLLPALVGAYAYCLGEVTSQGHLDPFSRDALLAAVHLLAQYLRASLSIASSG